MDSLEDRNLPASYLLSWDEETQEIIINIRRKVANFASTVGTKNIDGADKINKRVKELTDETGAVGFFGDIRSCFGFDNAMMSMPVEYDDDFISLRAEIPDIASKEKPEGIKKARENLAKLIASLEILFSHLNSQNVLAERELKPPTTQLLTLEIGAGYQRSITGVYSRTVVKELASGIGTDKQQSIQNSLLQIAQKVYDVSEQQKQDSPERVLIQPKKGIIRIEEDSWDPRRKSFGALKPREYFSSPDIKGGISFGTEGILSDRELLMFIVGLAQLSDAVAPKKEATAM